MHSLLSSPLRKHTWYKKALKEGRCILSHGFRGRRPLVARNVWIWMPRGSVSGQQWLDREATACHGVAKTTLLRTRCGQSPLKAYSNVSFQPGSTQSRLHGLQGSITNGGPFQVQTTTDIMPLTIFRAGIVPRPSDPVSHLEFCSQTDLLLKSAEFVFRLEAINLNCLCFLQLLRVSIKSSPGRAEK